MDIRAAIQAERFSEIESFLLERMESQGCGALEICRRTTADKVRIDWWEDLRHAVAKVSEDKFPVAAVGLDLSSYIDPPDDMPMDPAVEVAFYGDRDNARFSSATLDELYEASADYSAPWTGRWDQGGDTYSTSGLGDLTAYVLDHHEPCDIWAQYFLIFRYQQKMRELLRDAGLPHAMKALLGVHGFDPWLVTIMMDPKVVPLSRTPQQRYAKVRRHQLTGMLLEQLLRTATADGLLASSRTASSLETRALLAEGIRRMIEKGVLADTPYADVKAWMLEGADLKKFRAVLEEYYDPDRHPDDPAPIFRPQRQPLFGRRPPTLFGRRQ